MGKLKQQHGMVRIHRVCNANGRQARWGGEGGSNGRMGGRRNSHAAFWGEKAGLQPRWQCRQVEGLSLPPSPSSIQVRSSPDPVVCFMFQCFSQSFTSGITLRPHTCHVCGKTAKGKCLSNVCRVSQSARRGAAQLPSHPVTKPYTCQMQAHTRHYDITTVTAKAMPCCQKCQKAKCQVYAKRKMRQRI